MSERYEIVERLNQVVSDMADKAAWLRTFGTSEEADIEEAEGKLFAEARDLIQAMAEALQKIIDRAPKEKPEVFDNYGCFVSAGNGDDCAADLASLSDWEAAEIARSVLALLKGRDGT